jgi:hypothetical protein
MDDVKKMQTAKQTWTEKIQTTLIKGFTDEEWKQLVQDFKDSILTQPPLINLVGYPLGSRSARFVKNDIPRLLNDAFFVRPLNDPQGWYLDDTNVGTKNLYIPSDLFRERLLNQPIIIPDSPNTKEDEEESEEEILIVPTTIKKRDDETVSSASPKPLKKTKHLPSSSSATTGQTTTTTTLEELVHLFVSTKTQPSNDKNLSRFVVWMMFFYWAAKKGVNLIEDEFYKVFESSYPHYCTMKGSKKYYQNFSVHIRHAPRYPPPS